ncbi:MAG: sigma-70 family RNA polymerase sigma factor [Phycisphaerae bacterium]|nr:sigma-70 family RNA polymerase sigma factor [Saprospiraceae bacterium]
MDAFSLTYSADMQTSFTEAPASIAALKEKNFGMDAKLFEALLDGLEAGDERLFEQVFVSQYKRGTRHLMYHYSVGEQDAKDVVMNTLLDFRKLLLARKVTYGNLEAYFTRMVTTTYLKKRKNNLEISVERFSEDLTEDNATQYTEEEFSMFAQAWSGLCEKCQMVLKGYYYDDLPHAQIATLIGKNLASAKQDKHRCVEKLRKLFLSQATY